MARTIAITSQNGGTGKTTTAINIAAGLARFSDHKALLEVVQREQPNR